MDPCTPRGYARDTEPWKISPSYSADKSRYLSTLNPIGNFIECRSSSLLLLQKGKEKYPHKSYDIGSAFIPKLHGNFLATENFFHTSKFFRLSPKAFLSDLMVVGKRFCEEVWSKLRTEYHSLAEEDMLHYFFSSVMYIVALLHDSLGIALDDERFEPDMLAFSGCYYGGRDKERMEFGKIRKRWKTLHVSPTIFSTFR